MYEYKHGHIYCYFSLSKVIFKYKRKLVGTSEPVYMYVCIFMMVYGTLYRYRTAGFGFCQNHFRFISILKKYHAGG